MSAFAVTADINSPGISQKLIERNSTPIIAAIKSVTCPLALNDVSHEADSGSGFGGGWFFMLGYDCQGHRLWSITRQQANRHVRLADRGKAACRRGSKSGRDELVAHACWTRCDKVEAVVAHDQ